MKKGPRKKGTTYYQVGSIDNHWFCSKEDLKLSIVEWVEEAKEDGLTVFEVVMTKEEFDNLPEFEG